MRHAIFIQALAITAFILLPVGANMVSAGTEAVSNRKLNAPREILPHSASDRLWRQAVALAEKNRQWVPGTIRTSETVRDKDGATMETATRQISSGAGPGKAVSWTLVKSMENGTDTTDKNREHLEEYMAEFLQDTENNNPFLVARQNEIQVTPLDTVEAIHGETCRVFTYIHTMEGVAMQGKAWLRREDGLPIMIRLGTTEPLKEEEATITEYRMEVRFAPCTPERWYPQEARMETAFRLKLFPFMGWQGTSLEVITFEDHWLPEKQK